MEIRSTQSRRKDMHKVTWVSPHAKTTNQSDRILLERRQPAGITNVRMHRGVNYDSGHYLVKVTYRARIQTSKQQYTKERDKINLEKLGKCSVGDEYRKKLNKAWTEDEEEVKEVNIDVEIQWQHG